MQAALRSQARPASARLAFRRPDPCPGVNCAPPCAKQHRTRAIEVSGQVGLFLSTVQRAHCSDVQHRCVAERVLQQVACPRGRVNSREGAKP
jgi:hypothetical protein